MTSLFLRRLLLCSLLAPAALFAQGNSANTRGNTPGAGDPDVAWTAVTDLSRSISIGKTSNGDAKPKLQIAAEIAQQAARQRQAALEAKQFYTANPGHAKANEARKLEALTTIRGVELGNAQHEQAARTIAKAFRENLVQSLADRFDVALAADRMELSVKIRGRQAANRPENWKKIGDALRTEIGDVPALYVYYMEIARTADNATATRIAGDVLRSSVASAATKTRAQAVLDRNALLGKPVALRLTASDGSIVDLGNPSGRATVVVAWSPDDALVLSNIKRFEKSLPKNVRVVYVAMGGTDGQFRKGTAAATVPGVHCHATAGSVARAVNASLKLPYGPIPRAYVLNATGLLSGFGAIEDLPALLRNVAG